MAIPKEILKIERPKNTVLKATRTPNTYSVVKRTSKRVPGEKNPKPIELGVIGKIINGVYVPLPDKVKHEIDLKEYGPFAFCDLVCNCLFDNLLKFYELEATKKLYCIALLRTLDNGIVDDDIALQYRTSFLSEKYPNTALSPNTISKFLEETGQRTCIIDEFMNERIQQYVGDPIVVDGMLKNSNGEMNSFSEFSRKARVKNSKDINLIYAYDLAQQEPLACSVYPGNMLDFTAFKSFLVDHPIENGFLIMDKGFNENECKLELDRLNTKYIIPMPLSRKVIREFELDKNFTHCFKYDEDTIRAKKVYANGEYYYSFKSTYMEAKQKQGKISREVHKGTFDPIKFEESESKCGLIVFETNIDVEVEYLYLAYQERWEIEVLFNNYKNIINCKEVNVQGNYRLIATEFINFLSCIMSMKIKKYIFAKGLNNKYSQRKILLLLSKWHKKRTNKYSDQWVDVGLLKHTKELANILGV